MSSLTNKMEWNVVNLKKNPLQTKSKFLGCVCGGGGSTNDPLEGKFQGGGEKKTKEPSVGGGGVWIFSGTTQF